MKKIIAISFVTAVLLMFSSFYASENPSTDESNGDSGVVSNSQVWEYMHENVFTELNSLVAYDKHKSFSRCPSGFSQHMDDENSTASFVVGQITFAQGCNRNDFCHYKVDWKNKVTFLKKNEKDDFVALETFVKNEEKKIAKI